MLNPANAITNIESAEIPDEIFWAYIRSSTRSWSILKDNCSSVDTEQKTVTISTDDIEQKLPKDGDFCDIIDLRQKKRPVTDITDLWNIFLQQTKQVW